jgi:hypothetical protein
MGLFRRPACPYRWLILGGGKVHARTDPVNARAIQALAGPTAPGTGGHLMATA